MKLIYGLRNVSLVDMMIDRDIFDYCDLHNKYNKQDVRKLLEYFHVEQGSTWVAVFSPKLVGTTCGGKCFEGSCALCVD